MSSIFEDFFERRCQECKEFLEKQGIKLGSSSANPYTPEIARDRLKKALESFLDLELNDESRSLLDDIVINVVDEIFELMEQL